MIHEMRINNYECVCGYDKFVLDKDETGIHTGIYCALCGRWYKWANRNEKRLWNAFQDETEYRQIWGIPD